MKSSQITTLLFVTMCLALGTFFPAETMGQENRLNKPDEQVDMLRKRIEAQDLQATLAAANQNGWGLQQSTPPKTTQRFSAPAPQLSPNQNNPFSPRVNRNLQPTNSPKPQTLPTPNQRMPFGPPTGLPFNSNRTARQPSLRASSYNPAPKFPSNAKSVKKLYRADYEVDEASATMLQQLLTAKGEDKVEAKIVTDDTGLTHLRVTTDEKTQQAIGNFLAQVFPPPAKAKSVKANSIKPKAASTKLKPTLKFVSIKTPKMTCGGCAASVKATLTEAKCSEIQCDAATKTCTFKVKSGVDEKELLTKLAKANDKLEDWEISKD